MNVKVFGIGFQKTGTKSLAPALARRGFRVTGPNGFRDPDIATRYPEITARLSRRYDAFQDNPWPLVYREMDQLWPEARFILTVRDTDSWLASVLDHFGTTTSPMRDLIYGPGMGAPKGNEAHFVARMETHNLAVRTYFQNRPGKLLEMDLGAGDGWEKLCPFLNRPMPDKPFPHKNTAQRRKRLARIKAAEAQSARRGP
ncbi:MAG: sulfotransferase family protein [Paracoccaceae bacterium]